MSWKMNGTEAKLAGCDVIERWVLTEMGSRLMLLRPLTEKDNGFLEDILQSKALVEKLGGTEESTEYPYYRTFYGTTAKETKGHDLYVVLSE